MPLFGPPNVAKLEAKKDVPGLISALGYPKDPAVRRRAAEALGRLGDPSSVGRLVAALQDNDVRAHATGALIACGGTSVEPLIPVLKDQNPDVRKAAAVALGAIKDARAVEALIAALEDHAACKGAAEALGSIGDPRAVGPIIASMHSHLLREDAVAALRQIAEPAVEPLIRTLRGRTGYKRITAAVTLGQIGDPRAVEPLLAALDDKDWDVRRSAAKALVAMHGAGRIDEVQRAAILSRRDVLTAPRTHTFKHSDSTDLNNCGMNVHEDANNRHVDVGFEVEFP